MGDSPSPVTVTCGSVFSGTDLIKLASPFLEQSLKDGAQVTDASDIHCQNLNLSAAGSYTRLLCISF